MKSTVKSIPLLNMFKIVFACCLVAAAMAAPQGKEKEPIAIISLESEVNHDGSFHYSYEGADGNKANADGVQKSLGPDQSAGVVNGAYSYIGDDGQSYKVEYTADENGFQARGAHLPVAPEIPPAIARALQYIKEHPQVEKN